MKETSKATSAVGSAHPTSGTEGYQGQNIAELALQPSRGPIDWLVLIPPAAR